MQSVDDHSQNGEYRSFLEPYFRGRSGLVVEVGASEKAGSNAFDLVAKHNFSAILIEPISHRLVTYEYGQYRNRVVVEPVAIGPEEGVAAMHIHTAAGHHSVLGHWLPDTKTGHTKIVEMVRLSTVLEYYGVAPTFELLSVDTEGLDTEIIGDLIEKSQYRPEIIIVEMGIDKEAFVVMDVLLHSRGYKVLHQNQVNVGYGRVKI